LVVLALVGAACVTRDRPDFTGPGPQGGVGPQTTITEPTQDTTVQAGPGFFVVGIAGDPDGIDTLYFETEGGVTSFQPMVGGGDTIHFGLPLTTSGQSGQTITVRVFGTDRLGNRGDTAERRITVQ
jgi:hypothetical protein